MNPRLFIATPCYGGNVTVVYLQSLIQLQVKASEMNVPVKIGLTAGESLITRGRNNLVHDFLCSDSTHLFFIDADIEFDATQALRMLAYMENGQYDIVGAPYAKKKIHWDQVKREVLKDPAISLDDLEMDATNVALNPLNNTEGNIRLQNMCVEVRHVATGFMMIRRSVIEKMMLAYPELMYIGYPSEGNSGCDHPVWDLFETERVVMDEDRSSGMKRHLSEDYAFCDKWRRLGGKVYAFVGAELGHFGPMVYRGRVTKPVKQGVSA